jgi:hypothetical protein
MYGLPKNPFIESLELSVRASNVLRRSGLVNTLEEFMALDRETVILLPQAGVRTWEEIEQVQKHFRETQPAPAASTPAPLLARDMTLRDAAALAAFTPLVAYVMAVATEAESANGARLAAGAAWQFADDFMAAREGKSE